MLMPLTDSCRLGYLCHPKQRRPLRQGSLHSLSTSDPTKPLPRVPDVLLRCNLWSRVPPRVAARPIKYRTFCYLAIEYPIRMKQSSSECRCCLSGISSNRTTADEKSLLAMEEFEVKDRSQPQEAETSEESGRSFSFDKAARNNHIGLIKLKSAERAAVTVS